MTGGSGDGTRAGRIGGRPTKRAAWTAGDETDSSLVAVRLGMERTDLDEADDWFDVLLTSDEAQAANMTLEPGQAVGGPENVHEDVEQWLFVHEGAGRATVADEDVRLSTGDVVLIEPGDSHEIVNDGDEPLRTLNVYVPPLY